MAQDLSLTHEPIEPAADWPADLAPLRLSDEQLAFYEQRGYLSGVRILSEDQADALCEQLADLFDPDHDGADLWYEYHSNESTVADTVLFHALGAWRIKPGFHDILWRPEFCVPASQLLGGAVRFWHDQLFCKPARHGGVVAWHQDYSYWTRTVPMAHLTCWIALDDSTIDNGCLQYVPGSHRWDLLPVTGLAGDMNAIRNVLSDEQWEIFQQPAAAELKKGEATFHHPLMIHGSFENRTDRPRRATVINAFRDGVKSDTDDVILGNGFGRVPRGSPMQGQLFPLLYDPR